MAQSVVVRFLADDRQLRQTLGSLSSKVGGIGSGLTRSLTPAAVAFGAFSRTAFKEFDSGLDAIRAGTGATGDELKALGDSMKEVGGKVIQPLSHVGQVMADLSTRTGLTGRPLEQLTKQLLDLERLGVDASAETVTRAFGDWGIATGDQSAALDKLFRASQATGPSIERIGQLITQFGAPLRELGFGFEESAALIGKFEQEGVNVETVMAGLRQGLAKMARAGEDPAATFVRVTDEIKNAGSAAERNQKAFALFGARAGVDMAKAIEEGRFEIGELLAQVEGGEDTIAKAAKDTEDWSDRLAMLKNRVIGAVGPFGELGMAFAGIAAGIGPALVVLPKLGGAFGAVSGAFRALSAVLLANPWLLVAAAIIALVVVVVKNWGTIRDTVVAAWDAIWGATKSVWKFITDAVGKAIDFVVSLFMNFTGPGLLIQHWDTIWRKTVEIFGAVKKFIGDRIDDIVGFFRGLPGRIVSFLGALGKAAAGVGRAIIDGIADGVRGAVGFVGDFAKGLGNAVIDWVNRNVIGRINDAIPNKINLPGPIPDVNLPDNPIPKIPTLHDGGVFRAPPGQREGLALLRDRERVVTPEQDRLGAGGVTLVVHNIGDLPEAGVERALRTLAWWRGR